VHPIPVPGGSHRTRDRRAERERGRDLTGKTALVFDILVNNAALGRTASADDIAAQVVTFCRAGSVTGQVLVVDGGMPAVMH